MRDMHPAVLLPAALVTTGLTIWCSARWDIRLDKRHPATSEPGGDSDAQACGHEQ